MKQISASMDISMPHVTARCEHHHCPMPKSTKTTLASTGDVWDDDGAPVPVQTHD
jgi:hypothetical protein